MRIFRVILGVFAVIFALGGVCITAYAISQIYFEEDIVQILATAGMLLCVYLPLQFLFLVKFGFYKADNAERYNKMITFGIPTAIIAMLAAYTAFEYQKDVAKQRNEAVIAKRSRDDFSDFYDLFTTAPKTIPDSLAVKFLGIDSDSVRDGVLRSVNHVTFGDDVGGFIYKIGKNERSGEEIFMAMLKGRKLVQTVKIGYNIPTQFGRSICAYEFETRQMVVMTYQNIRTGADDDDETFAERTEEYVVNGYKGTVSLK
jgi:hypothetical protein